MNKPTEKQKVGQLGEDIAVKYLENNGFDIIRRNYRKKCGEIDIVAKKAGIVHFIEVKSVSELANSRLGRSENIVSGVSRETDNYRPEDNIHPYKLKRLTRTIQVYLLENYKNTEPEWVFDAITVRLDRKNRRARVQFLGNLVL